MKDIPRPATAAFRRADAGRSDFGHHDELRAELQRRLRIAGILLAGTGFALASTNLVSLGSLAWQGQLWHPLSANTQLWYVALVVAVVYPLRPGRIVPLRRLRVVETLLFWPLALFTVALLIGDFETLRGIVSLAPRDFGMSHSAFWVLGMVAYGALVPNTARRTSITLGLLALMSFVPDAWAYATGILTAADAPLFVSFKAVFVLAAWVAVSFGSYRYETVARSAAAARELGQYLLGERLGAGGMGEVYRGEHRLLRRPVAIKLITPAQAGSPDAIARFEREAQATAQLTHPNTVQVFDYGRAEDGTFYCVMEYLPGRTLEQVVRDEGPMPVGRAIAVLTQVASALAEAHATGLVHRDIKPSNVMLTERGGITDVAKLLDFGLVVSRASSDGRLTEAGMFVGTPEFMSPEQCAGADAEVGPASDIYSLGALAYFLVTGRSPFAGRSATQMLAAHLYETPALLRAVTPTVPKVVEVAVQRALAKRPEDRFASAAAFARALVGTPA